MNDFREQLADALGLAPDATAEDILARIEELPRARQDAGDTKGGDPDPRTVVPVETAEAMLAERNTALATLSAERAAARIEEALRKGHVSPAMTGWATALCRSDVSRCDAFLAAVPPAFAHLGEASRTASVPEARGGEVAQSAVAAAICTQLGLAPGARGA